MAFPTSMRTFGGMEFQRVERAGIYLKSPLRQQRNQILSHSAGCAEDEYFFLFHFRLSHFSFCSVRNGVLSTRSIRSFCNRFRKAGVSSAT